MPNSRELLHDYLDGTPLERSVAMLAKLVVESFTFAIFASLVVGVVFFVVESTSMSLPTSESYAYIFGGVFLLTFRKGWCFQTRTVEGGD